MTPAEFKRSLDRGQPPRGLTPALRALWWAKSGDWGKAHALVMDENDAGSAWVHAYLHRFERDEDNARYWYRQARRPAATGSLDDEWTAILVALL